MDRELKLMLTIILPFMFLVAALYGGGYYLREFTMTSQYEYEVSVEVEDDIHDVNITVPFPSELSDGDFILLEGWQTWIHQDEDRLSISAENMSAGEDNTLYLSMGTDEEIDAWEPLEDEPMLDPDANFTEFEVPDDSDAKRYYSYNYTGIQVSYEADDEVDIEISVELLGRNRWWLLDDVESRYHDKLSTEVEGEGEFTAQGHVEVGVGG